MDTGRLLLLLCFALSTLAQRQRCPAQAGLDEGSSAGPFVFAPVTRLSSLVRNRLARSLAPHATSPVLHCLNNILPHTYLSLDDFNVFSSSYSSTPIIFIMRTNE